MKTIFQLTSLLILGGFAFNSSVGSCLVPPCYNLDATNMNSGEYNVEDCGTRETNLITIPSSAQFKLGSDNGATCSAKIIGSSPKGQLVRLSSSLDLDSSQSCKLFIYTAEEKATIEFLAQGS